MALVVEAASRRLDFEQSRDGSATGSKKPDHVPIDFPTGSGSLTLVPAGTVSEVGLCQAVLVFIALGANLGDAQSTVLAAIQSISQLPQTRLLRSSSLYRTAALGDSGPDFINAVIAVSTRLDGNDLLLELQHLENLAERVRTYPNAPRTLDIDILLYGDATINTPTLQVPHPRMIERAFVLVPLAEISSGRVSPSALQAVSMQAIQRVVLD